MKPYLAAAPRDYVLRFESLNKQTDGTQRRLPRPDPGGSYEPPSLRFHRNGTRIPSAVATAEPASAVADLLTCSGTTTTTYDPPLTNQDQTTTITNYAEYGPCVSPTRPNIQSGTADNTWVATSSCLRLLSAGSVVFTIAWNDDPGEFSTFSGDSVTQIVGAGRLTTTTGTVTDGEFESAAFVHQTIGPATDILLCNAGLGTVSGLTGVIELVVAGA